MGNTCENGNCGSGSGSSGCGCGSSNCGCVSGSKKSSECCDTGCSMCNKMVMLADRAWEAAIVEKMKALWISQMGEKFDEIAQASVETSMAFHMNKMKGMTEVKENAKKIQAAFQ